MNQLHLVLVDDNLEERNLMQEARAEFAPEVLLTTIGTSTALFDHLASHRFPHLLLVDLRLGRELGSEIAERLQRHAAHAVPLVILSTAMDTAEKTRCLQAGACDFWVKPRMFEGYAVLFEQARLLVRKILPACMESK